MNMARRGRRIGLIVAVALAVAGCSSSDSAPTAPGGGGGGGGGGDGSSVSIANFAFSPASLTVAAGTTVSWKNNDGVAHTVTSDAGAFDSGNVNGSSSYSHTFDTKGTFAYHCAIHPGMTGTIVVQ